MKEIWKDIEGFEKLYQVSNLGRIRSLFRYKIILNPEKTRNGYLRVMLCKEGKRKHYLIHRLVAQAFIPNPNNLPEINHKNEIKTDNNLNNLYWCDSNHNCNYGTRNDRISSKIKIPIIQMKEDYKIIKIWNSALDVEKTIGINRCGICNCLKGKTKTAGGYIWRYADE